MVTSLKIASDRAKGVEVRPTLIIGLGGTGTVIAQWAHHFITQVFGEVPPFIRFLALDTDVQEQSKVGRLPIAAFVNLYERLDLRPILREYREHKRDFPFLSWLNDMPLDSSLISSGCQGLSRLGRVVYFLTRESVIEPEVTRNLRELTTSELAERVRAFDDSGQFVLAQTGRPLVHICASVCGGTGSGLLLDLAYDVRHWGRSVSQSEPDVIGHLLLPEAFSVGEDLIREKLRSVACAMLEQIEFLASRHRSDVRIVYRSGETRTISPLEAPFDLCYLVNGNSRAGSADRATLAAMMGRMVAAFAYEPIGREILADANNKQQDILAREEPPRRRRFFATYGLACGAAQSEELNRQHVAAVRWWVARALAELATEDRKALRDKQAGAKQELRRLVEEVRDKEVRELHLGGVHSTVPRQIADYVRKAVQGQLAELDAGLRRDVAAELDRRLAHLQRDLCDQAVHSLERGMHQPVTLFRAYYEVLSEMQRTLPEDDRAKAIRSRAVGEFKEEYASFERAREAARQIWHKYAPQLAQTVIDQVLREYLGRLAEWVKSRVDALERSASSAPRQATGAPGQEALSVPNGIRLIDLGYPLQLDSSRPHLNGSSRRDGDTYGSPLEEIKRRFVKDLIAPTVRELLDLSDVSDQSVDQLVLSALNDRERAFDQFWQTYCEESLRLIYGTSDNQAVTGHPLTPKLMELKKQSQPRLAMNQKGKYKEPLEVAFSQHTLESCFPKLLRPLIGHNLRETFVAQEYVQKTNVLLVLAQFAYGISVPGIDNYDSYRAAIERYIANTDMRPNHLWLDDRWYEEFKFLRGEETVADSEIAEDSVAEIVNELTKVMGSLAREVEGLAEDATGATGQRDLKARTAALGAMAEALSVLNNVGSETGIEKAIKPLEGAETHIALLQGEDGRPHELLAAVRELRDRLVRVLSRGGQPAAGA